MYFVWKLGAIEWSQVFFHSHLIVVWSCKSEQWVKVVGTTNSSLVLTVCISHIYVTQCRSFDQICFRYIAICQYILYNIYIYVYTHNHLYIYIDFHLAPWTSWLKASSNDSSIEALREEFGTSSQRFVAETWGWSRDGFRYSTHTIHVWYIYLHLA